MAAQGTVDEVLTPGRLVAQGYMSESQASWMFRGNAQQREAAHV
jgi:zinc/manganese transport system ATP-binding protein